MSTGSGTVSAPTEALPFSERELSRAPARSLRFELVVFLFFVSGATGLVDQVCFSKYLGYIVGATAYAVSAVLAAFMAGLALGAHLGGRLSRRVERPLAVYGVLELAVAVSVCVAPALFSALEAAYVLLVSRLDSLAVVSLVRWALALLVVVIPTTAMGMTLPLLSRLLDVGTLDVETRSQALDFDRRRRRLGLLYAVNTAGGAFGALTAAYFLLPTFGMRATLIGAGVVAGLVGVVALAHGKGFAGTGAPADRATTSERTLPQELLGKGARLDPVLALVAAGSGAVVFVSEVVFTHLLALVAGTSAYVFGLILAIFLVYLFLGASLASAVERRFGALALPLGLASAALALGATLPLWDFLPLLFSGLGNYVTSFAGREAVRGIVVAAILALPVTLMGLTFPLVLQRVAHEPDVGSLVGRLTARNTLGAVLGSVLAGYLLLPALGSERALGAIVLVFALSAVGLGLLLPSAKARLRIAAFGGVAACLPFVSPRWDLARLTAGTNVYFDGYQAPEAVLFLHEDVHGGVTTVARRAGVDFLYTNGKFQGNTGWEMEAQRSFAHYPSLFVKNFGEALVIGVGTGTTLGTVAAYPWRRLHAVDISPGIVAAAERYFAEPNLGVFSDPRLEVTIDDGRNFLLLQDDRAYDAILMELSSIWFAGAANLYSQEFYAIVKSRLKPGGVFQQWVQLHHIHFEDFAAVLHTLRLEFPHVALFYAGGQGVIVAALEPLVSNPEHRRALTARPEMRRVLSRPFEDLFDDLLVVDQGMDRFIASAGERAGRVVSELRSTDDNLYLEYATPRGNVLPWETREELVAQLAGFRDDADTARLRGD